MAVLQTSIHDTLSCSATIRPGAIGEQAELTAIPVYRPPPKRRVSISVIIVIANTFVSSFRISPSYGALIYYAHTKAGGRRFLPLTKPDSRYARYNSTLQSNPYESLNTRETTFELVEKSSDIESSVLLNIT